MSTHPWIQINTYKCNNSFVLVSEEGKREHERGPQGVLSVEEEASVMEKGWMSLTSIRGRKLLSVKATFKRIDPLEVESDS